MHKKEAKTIRMHVNALYKAHTKFNFLNFCLGKVSM